MSTSSLPLDFRVAVLATDGVCVAAREGSECEGDLQAHHVVTQQQLRRHGLDELLWDPDNGAAVCERHHRRHHSGREPIWRDYLPTRCLAFAERVGLVWLIDRYYA